MSPINAAVLAVPASAFLMSTMVSNVATAVDAIDVPPAEAGRRLDIAMMATGAMIVAGAATQGIPTAIAAGGAVLAVAWFYRTHLL